MRTFIAAKIHGITVTACHFNYHGSQGIPASVMRAVGLAPYEQVHVANLANGQRWVTYALAGPEGVCTLNGAAAHLGGPGDQLIIMAYRQEERFSGARVAFVTEDNRVRELIEYPPGDDLTPVEGPKPVRPRP
jgi:aspartate 1-decarboxylase